MFRRVFAGLTMLSLVSLSAVFAGDVDTSKAKCPVADKPVQASKHVDYKGGKVYFCCGNCPKAFEKNTGKYAAKANHQLVATDQTEQKACPFTGAKLNPDTEIKVGTAEVAFCCNNCKGKAEKMEKDEQVKTIFSDEAFKKGFAVKSESE